MFNVIAAEGLKLRSHRATWFLIWLYPLGFLAIFLIAATMGTPRGGSEWYDNTTAIWGIPRQAVGRQLAAAFVALAFAGEYGWNTWKLIIPHRGRTALMASKYLVVCILFAIAFTLTAGLAIVCAYAEDVLTGDKILAGMSAGALLQAHANSALAALAPLLLTIAVTSLAAVLTRSTLAALIIGIVLIAFEQIIFGAGPQLSRIIPNLAWDLYHALPGYHLANLTSWIQKGVALSVPFPAGDVVALPWQISLAVVTGWTVAATVAALVVFRRQDIN